MVLDIKNDKLSIKMFVLGSDWITNRSDRCIYVFDLLLNA